MNLPAFQALPALTRGWCDPMALLQSLPATPCSWPAGPELLGWLAPALVAVAVNAGGAAPAAAFEALLAPLLGSAFGVALHLTRNRADAEDLVQEAALNAFRGFATFEPGTNFKAWFFRILTNCFASRYRKTRRERDDLALDDAPELYLYSKTAEAGMHGRDANPAQALLDKLDTEAVTAAIEALPEEYRVVSTLYFMQDFSYEEIAQVLGCPIGTVRSRLHRGRRMLQKALWHVARERGVVGDTGGDGEAA
jgi:RNA polymerase sigma-70 factor (ECF subfamily)